MLIDSSLFFFFFFLLACLLSMLHEFLLLVAGAETYVLAWLIAIVVGDRRKNMLRAGCLRLINILQSDVETAYEAIKMIGHQKSKNEKETLKNNKEI